MALANLASKGVGIISPKKGHSRSRSFDFSHGASDFIQQPPNVISPPSSPRGEPASSANATAPPVSATASAPVAFQPAADQSSAVKNALLKKKRKNEHQRNLSIASAEDVQGLLQENEGEGATSKKNPVNRLGRNISSAFFAKKDKKHPLGENASDSGSEDAQEHESDPMRGIFKVVKAAAGVVTKNNKSNPLIELEPHEAPLEVPLLPTDGDLPTAVRMRNKVINEIILTERDYVQDLQYLNKNFREPMTKQQILNQRESSALFSNVSLLIGVNKELLDHLQKEISSGNPMIGSSFLSIADYLKMYSVYCNNQQNASDMKKHLSENNANFRQWILQRFPTLDVGVYAVSSHLIKPVQRVCKYPLLLRELLKHTERDHADYGNLEAAFVRIEQVVGTINQSSVVQGDIFKLAQLQARFHEGEKLGLMTPTRRFKDEALFKEVNDTKEALMPVHYFLFNDLVLKAVALKRHTIAKLGIAAASAGNLKVKSMMQLSKITTAEPEAHPLLAETGSAHMACSFVLVYGDSKTILVADSVEEKDKWIANIAELKAQLPKKTTVTSESSANNILVARTTSTEGGLVVKPRSQTQTEGSKTASPNSRMDEIRQMALEMKAKLNVAPAKAIQEPEAAVVESAPVSQEPDFDDWAPPPVPAPSANEGQPKAEPTEPQPPIVLLPKPLRICIRLSTETDDDFQNIYLEAKHMQTLKEKIASKYGNRTIQDIVKNNFQGGLVKLNDTEIQHIDCDDEVIVTLAG
eukprot:TRINITY_DN1390_c0_g10_i1.p1 TRINITY_DN1390_c0_g10~~TRINITY_DN1390_c0_g10_i1.p1  ORF type:complete len:753 (-),score=172.16 TRINITY_DN1390_c0_g10_i1:98-2356(-)